MKNRKGFSLVELLAVIALLGIILLIAVPTIRRYINKGTKVYYSSLEREVKTAGSEYLNSYRTLLPRVIGHSVVINLDELVENNYIDPVVDENENLCTGQVVAIKVKSQSYEYYSCIKCGKKYISESNMCIEDENSNTGFANNELDNVYDDTGKYRVVLDKYEYEVGQTEEFILPSGRVEHLENDEWKPITAEPVVSTKRVDTNTLGVKTVTYSYHGSKAYISVNVVDKIAPSKPEVVIKYESASGNNYQGNWYSGKLYVEYKSVDYSKKNILGSGIRNYEYSLDGVNWIEVRKDNNPNKEHTDWNIIDVDATEYPIISEDGEYTISVRARDNNNNVSEINTYVIRIDTHAPDCNLIVSGTVGLENWYKSGINVEYDQNVVSDATSRILTTPITARRSDNTVITTGTNSVSINTPEENIRIYGTITDQAGNVSICEAPALDGGNRLKLDPRTPEIPVITVTDGNGVGGRWYTGTNLDEYKTAPESGVWHINDTTMTFSGANNLSKNIYYYTINTPVQADSTGRATNATNGEGFYDRELNSSDIKVVQDSNTTGTTYYAMVCSVAGNCSGNSNYVVKLDKTTPNAPIITATDGNPLGNLWHISEDETSSTPISGVWHIANTTLTLSGVDNISGNMYIYRSESKITINNYGRAANGTRNNSTGEITQNTTAQGTTYYGVTCSVAGKCSSNSNYVLKIDKTTPDAPTITAHDNKASGSWHNASDVRNNNGNVTLSLSGGSNVSGNIYWHRASSEPSVTLGRVSNGTKGTATHGTNTSSTTYYAKTCSVAGKCSGSSNYEVKLDKSAPNIPDSVARNGNSNGTVLSNIGTDTWRNHNIWWGSFSASDNGTSKIDHYEYSTNCTGKRTGNLDTNGYTYTDATNYKFCIRSVDNAGNVSDWSSAYYFKVDTTPPTKPTSGAIGSVSGSSATGSIKTDAGGSTDASSGVASYKYMVTNSNTKPAKTDSKFSTSKDFTRSCGTSYYGWAVAVDAVGNISDVVSLGNTSDGANSYSDWTQCSAKCDGGTQTRTNSCALVTTGLSQSCNTQGCCTSTTPSYSSVTDWGACSLTCGGGIQTKYATLTYVSTYNGQACTTPTTVVYANQPCNSQSCCSVGTVEFGYTGGVQSFTIPNGCAGTYKLEVWGAAGGSSNGTYGSDLAGAGGYSTGTVSLSEGTTLYIVVGGQGEVGPGGFNGGGEGGHNKWDDRGGGGGGATHIGTTNSLLRDTAPGNVYIVAGGGGGAAGSNSWAGSGGGLTGGNGGQDWPGAGHTTYGGTQSEAGGEAGSHFQTWAIDYSVYNTYGGYGFGGNGDNYLYLTDDYSTYPYITNGGGGGGWYGGGGGGGIGKCYGDGGGGGSGYVGGVSGGAMSNGARAGNGYAKITKQ